MRILANTCFLLATFPAGSAEAANAESESLAEALTVLQRDADRTAELGAGPIAVVWERLRRADVQQIPQLLDAMREGSEIANNWIRAAVDSVCERTLVEEGDLAAADLQAYVEDREHSPSARRLAYEWLRRSDQAAAESLLPGMLDDPSLELRYDAVARLSRAAKQFAERGANQQAIVAYRRIVRHGRDLEQTKAAIEALEKRGEHVDLARTLGVVRTWSLLGPFENRGGKGYSQAYPPEQSINLETSYQDRDGKPARWQQHRTEDPLGEVDLNSVYGELKGAVVYAHAEIDLEALPETSTTGAESSGPTVSAQVRFGCICACKVWINGELAAEHEIYHAGSSFDQYVANVQLRRGRNSLLVKVCQNEQTESWAKVWKFQLRVCDPTGGGLAGAP